MNGWIVDTREHTTWLYVLEECTSVHVCVRTVRQYQPEESCVREPQNHIKWAYVEDDDDDGDRQDDDDDRLEEVKSMMIG